MADQVGQVALQQTREGHVDLHDEDVSQGAMWGYMGQQFDEHADATKMLLDSVRQELQALEKKGLATMNEDKFERYK